MRQRLEEFMALLKKTALTEHASMVLGSLVSMSEPFSAGQSWCCFEPVAPDGASAHCTARSADSAERLLKHWTPEPPTIAPLCPGFPHVITSKMAQAPCSMVTTVSLFVHYIIQQSPPPKPHQKKERNPQFVSMANPSPDDNPPISRAQFYTHDQVAAEQNGQSTIDAAVAHLPGLPFFAPLLGRTDARFRKTISLILQRFASEVHRPLTPEEADHMARHQQHRLVINAWGDVAYLASGIWLWKRGAATGYPNPLGKPHPNFNNQVFGEGFLPRGMQVRGPAAWRVWNGLRLAACVGLAYVVVGRTVFPTYATVRVTMDMLEDPALKAYLEERTKLDMQGKRQRFGPPGRGQGQMGQTPGQIRLEQTVGLGQSTVQAEAQTKTQVQGQTQGLPPVTGGFGGDGETVQGQGWGEDSGFTEEHQEKPVVAAPQRPAVGSQTSGSAWERLRRSAGVGGSAPSQGDQAARPQSWVERRRAAQQASSEQGTDSYTYSESDEEKSLARQQAQKEFDAMLERERQGSEGESRGRW